MYIPFELLNVLSFRDSGRQIALKNKTASKFKRQRLFRIIVMHLPFENYLFTLGIKEKLRHF